MDKNPEVVVILSDILVELKKLNEGINKVETAIIKKKVIENTNY